MCNYMYLFNSLQYLYLPANRSKWLFFSKAVILQLQKNKNMTHLATNLYFLSLHIQAASFWASFLRGPKKFFFSSKVWKRPWPYLLEVSMNLRLIFSIAFFLNVASRDWKIKTVVAVIDIWHISGLTLQVIIYHTFLRVITLFLDPMQHPLIMTKSWLTSP